MRLWWGGLRRIFTAKLFIFVVFTFVISGEKKRKEYNLSTQAAPITKEFTRSSITLSWSEEVGNSMLMGCLPGYSKPYPPNSN